MSTYNGNNPNEESNTQPGRHVRGTLNQCLVLAFQLLLSAIFISTVFANPEGGQVSAGNASIASTNSTTVQINQSSDKAVIDWRTYNVSPNETVQYLQPTSQSITLNRINPGMGASVISGTILANGKIILLNPAGMVFTSSARVDVSGLIATTANISNQDFMAGNFHFTQSPNWNGAIINNGRITIENEGIAALVAPGVVNNGVIIAKMGKVILASGAEYTIDFYGDQMIQFGVGAISEPAIAPDGSTLHSAVSNAGKIVANGGTVLLTAKTAGTVLDHAINMSGHIEANAVSQQGGMIILSGGDNGSVRVSGKMTAMGKHIGQQGGTVKVLGDTIQLVDNAAINVSGKSGGGTILIGGNYHGLGPEQNATETYVAPTVKLNANALLMGDGGKVIVWSHDNTQFFGTIVAKGGLLGGNGGFVETSGHYLDVTNAEINLNAPFGEMGTWLLDPTNIWIASSLANAQAAGMTGSDNSASTGTGGNPNTFAATGSVTDSFLLTTTLQTALGSASVIVSTTNASGAGAGNINLVNPITWSSANNLTLTAASNINLLTNATITGNGTGGLIINAAGAFTQNTGAILAGTMPVTFQGSTNATLNLTNTYSGITTIGSGTNVAISTIANQGTSSAIGTGTILLNGGTLNYTGGTISVTRNLSVGASGGTLQASSATAGTTLTLTGTLNIASSGGGANPLTIAVNPANIVLNPGTITTALSNLTVTGSGTGTLTLSKTGIYTGTTTITSGTLKNGINNALATTTSLIFNGSAAATYDMNNFTQGNLAALSGTDTNAIVTNSGATARTLTLANSSNASYAGILSGNLAFTLSSTGTPVETFSNAASTYTGATTLTSGTLSVAKLNASGSNSSIGTGSTTPAISLGATGVLQYTGTGDSTNRAITLTASGGTLDASGTGAVTFSGGATGNTFRLNLIGSGSGIFSGVLANTTGGVTKAGSGTWTLSNTNTYTGTTIVNAGTLTASVAAGLGSGSAGISIIPNASSTAILDLTALSSLSNTSAYTINSSAASSTAQLNTSTGITLASAIGLTGTSNVFSVAANTTTLSGIISGAGGSITKTGAGTLTLSNSSNAYTGTTTINNGTLSATAAGALGSGSAGINITPNASATAILDISTLTSLSNTSAIQFNSSAGSSTAQLNTSTGITLGGAIGLTGTSNIFSVAANTTTLSGAITGVGGLTKSGAGILSLAGTGNANLYSGVTSITAGTLQQATNANNFSANSQVNLSNVAGAILNLNALAGSIGSLTGGGATGGNVALTSAVLTIGNDNTSPAAYAGVISSTTTGGGITKVGTGTLTLSGTNTYTGVTTINNGTLSATVSGALGSGSAGIQITPSASATAILDLTALSSLSNTSAYTFNSSAASSLAQLNTSTGITLASAIGLTGTSNVFSVAANTTALSGAITGGGAITKTGAGTLTLSNTSNAYTGLTTINNGTLSATVAAGLGTGSAGVQITPSASATAILDLSTITSLSNTGSLQFNSAATSSTAQLNTSVAISLSNAIGLAGTNNVFSVAANNTTLSGATTGTGGLTKIGSGTLSFSDSNNNTYSGVTNINAGTLQQIFGGNDFSANSQYNLANVAGATLNLNGAPSVIGSLTGGGTLGGETSSKCNFLGVNLLINSSLSYKFVDNLIIYCAT